MKRSPDKTDFADARLLADLDRTGYLPAVWLAPLQVRQLRQLVGHRQSLVDQRRTLKLQVGAILREYRVKIEALEPGRAPGRWSRPWVLRVRDNGRLPEHVRWIVGEKLDEIEHVGTRVARVEERLRQATAGDATVARPWPDCGRSRASER